MNAPLFLMEEDYFSDFKITGVPPETSVMRRKKVLRVKGNQIRGGFSFPIGNEQEIERLERSVVADEDIRDDYIAILKRKPKSKPISVFMQYVFADKALGEYNFRGANGKRAMRGYEIFTNCFLEAYKREKLSQDVLCDQITIAVKQSRNRMRQRTFRARKSVKSIAIVDVKSEYDEDGVPLS